MPHYFLQPAPLFVGGLEYLSPFSMIPQYASNSVTHLTGKCIVRTDFNALAVTVAVGVSVILCSESGAICIHRV